MTTKFPHVSRRNAFQLWMYLIRDRCPCSLKMDRRNPPLGRTSQHRAICQRCWLGVGILGPSKLPGVSVKFRFVFPFPLVPLSCMDSSMVGPRAQLGSTMRLYGLAETCNIPAGIDTTTSLICPSLAIILSLSIGAYCAGVQQAITEMSEKVR